MHCYHVYKDVWTHSISKEFICYQEQGNNHVRHIAAVQGGEDVLGQLPRTLSSVAFSSSSMMAASQVMVTAHYTSSNEESEYAILCHQLQAKWPFWCMLEVLSHKTTHIIIAVKVHSKIKVAQTFVNVPK